MIQNEKILKIHKKNNSNETLNNNNTSFKNLSVLTQFNIPIHLKRREANLNNNFFIDINTHDNENENQSLDPIEQFIFENNYFLKSSKKWLIL